MLQQLMKNKQHFKKKILKGLFFKEQKKNQYFEYEIFFLN